MKKIMIIGAGILQVPAIIKAKELGLHVIALDMNPEAPGFKISDESIQLSTNDIQNAVKVAEEIKPDAVITIASDMPIRTVAAIGERCGLVTISPETALKATDKGEMRKTLMSHNIPIPRFYVISSLEEYKLVTNNFSGDYIVKPADNSGSRGIYLVNKMDKSDDAFRHAKAHSRSGSILVEEYMMGPEVSVETLTVDDETHVISITDKLTTGAPHFTEMGHSIPSQLPDKVINEIKNLAISAIKAIGINVGPSHTEIIITEDGPKIVELGARLGGDNITTHLVPLATGIDMVECTIRLALGEKIEIFQKYQMGAAIRYFNAPEGILKSIEYLTVTEDIEGVEEIRITKGIGESVTKIRSSTDRVGYIISRATSPREAVALCEEVASSIKFIVT
ncbi:ATP-grasp domain-containing protein [Paenibacillus sp.]|uniref:ATP-grasp domain-containing protein n=1 Tax=Paenibacillus sp. TaxID=58172 RepID=UPI002810E1D0|nr:ATP-grasp domain-containing protein [Paenibacillus sp.]